MVVVVMPVSADQISEQQVLLDQLNQQMDQQQNNLNSATKTEKTIMGQVQSIEQQTARTQLEIRRLTDNISYLQNNISATEKQIKIQQQELDNQTQVLGERLVVIYEQGESSYLEVLLGANDLKDFITRFEMLKTIIDQDRDLIDTINTNKKNLDNKIADLEVQKRSLQADQASQEANKLLLAGQLNEKKTVLDSVQTEKEKYAQAIAELEQASAEAEAMIRRLQGKGDGSRIGTGTYTWPTPGYKTITSAFGMRFHPILKVNKLHTGIDIGAPSGAKIVAADGGTVIFSGWLGAYGNAIIIDHGAGISTLYGHQSALLVNEGQTVAKGQQIGRVGSTGWSTGAHLHFEVRKNGTPVSPAGFV
jgi:murein DD-endopeptidase MepM/ murein hydrolase activator NlpD